MNWLLPLTALVLLGCSTVIVTPDETDPPVDDPDPPPPGPRAFCEQAALRGGAAGAALALHDHEKLVLLWQDGTRKERLLFDASVPEDAVRSVSTASGAGLLVVSARWAPQSDIWDKRGRLLFLDLQGNVLDSIEPDADMYPLGVGADGTVLLSTYHKSNPSTYTLRHPDGSLTEFAGFDASGAPLADGWVTGYVSSGTNPGFFRPADGLVKTLSHPALGYSEPREGGFVYLASGTGGPTLVHETPSAAALTALPALQGATGDLYLLGIGAAHALVLDAAKEALWRVERTSGVMVRADATPTGGFTPLADSCGINPRRLTRDGLLADLVRDGGAARLVLHDPNTQGFSPIGLPIEAPGSLEFGEQSGTFILNAGDGFDTFCPIHDWSGAVPSDAIAPMTTQLIRPSAGTTTVIEGVYSWAVSLSDEGTCAAVPGDDGTTRLVDVMSGTSLELGSGPNVVTWLR